MSSSCVDAELSEGVADDLEFSSALALLRLLLVDRAGASVWLTDFVLVRLDARG